MSARNQDCCTILGLTSDADDNAVRAAYKKLALQWHPDRHLVGKEAAAQMFIQVNRAYHTLMDGKESTHSSSMETSSTTSAPTSSSADPTRSDTTQASSRPPSANSNASKRSSPQSSKSSSSAPHDGHSKRTTHSGTQSTKPPSSSSSAASSDGSKRSSHPRSGRASPEKNQSRSDRMRRDRKSSKSRDHDPPCSAAPETRSPASTCGPTSEGLDGSVHSKPPDKAASSIPTSAEPKHYSCSEKTSQTSTGRSHPSQPVIPPPSGRLHKSPKVGFADEFVHKLSKGAMKGRKESLQTSPRDQDAVPCASPLRAINTPRGPSKQWFFSLPLTLDEMYHGTNYRFLVTRELLSHRTEQVEISIDIPPGMRSGTRIVCPRTGHQRKDGTLQDVVFLVEEVPNERFSRVKDDLFLDVCIPWADPLADRGGEICVQGIDGNEIIFTLPYPIYDEATEGRVLVKGAGMPIRDGRKTVGRGDMIIRWRIVFAPHQSKWQTLKKALHLDV